MKDIRALIISAGLALSLAASAKGQSLFRPRDEAPRPVSNDPNEPRVPANEDLRASSMLYIDPPRPRQFGLHEQIMILIDENSQQSSNESLETKKDFKLDSKIKSMPSLKDLIEGELRTGDSDPILTAGAEDKRNFKGEGSYTRNDRLTARIAATVIDVKPNGLLVLEARKTISSNGETKTLVLSGIARREDVTTSNTVLSSQLADLSLTQNTEGELRDASSKGWISRVLEAIFDF